MPLLSPYDEAIQARLTPVAPVAPTMPAMSSGAPEDSLLPGRRLRKFYESQAQQGIDPRIAAILARREERLAGQESEIAQQEARSPWDALARAGAAMASSQSPFFGQGIARGVTAGLDELNQGRAEAVRRRMAVGDARDDLEMQRLEQEGAGRRAALANLESDLKIGGEMATAARAEAEARLAIAKATPDPVMRQFEVMKAQREIDRIDAQIEADRALARQRDRSGGEGGGSGGGNTVFERRAENILRTQGQAAYDEFMATGKVAGAGADLTPTQRGVVVQKMRGLSPVEAQLERVATLAAGDIPFSGGISGYVPFSGAVSGKAGEFDKAVDLLRSQIRNLTRTPGEGSMSDYESRLAAAILPSRTDTPEARAEALRGLQELVKGLRAGYGDMIGGTPRPAPVAPTSGGFRVVGKRKQ